MHLCWELLLLCAAPLQGRGVLRGNRGTEEWGWPGDRDGCGAEGSMSCNAELIEKYVPLL